MEGSGDDTLIPWYRYAFYIKSMEMIKFFLGWTDLKAKHLLSQYTYRADEKLIVTQGHFSVEIDSSFELERTLIRSA